MDKIEKILINLQSQIDAYRVLADECSQRALQDTTGDFESALGYFRQEACYLTQIDGLIIAQKIVQKIQKEDD